MLKIAVLEADHVREELQGAHGTYPEMVERLLAPHLSDARFDAVSVIDEDSLPAPSSFDAYVITGSRHGIYEDLAWIDRLQAFVRDVAMLAVPQIGICFGHQVMAQAFGGHVVQSQHGWGCGAQTYDTDFAQSGAVERLTFHAFHQDQVIEAPPGARLIAGNAFCPIAGLVYPGNAASVQFHPEFDAAFIADLLALLDDSAIPQEVAEHARATLGGTVHNSSSGKWMARFIRCAVGDVTVKDTTT